MPQPGTLLTTGEAAEHTGLSTDLIRDLAARGLIRVLVLPSGHRRFYVADLDRYLTEATANEATA